MALSRNDEWNSSGEIYSPSEVEAVLRSLGIDIRDETENDFLSFCPYHGNTDSPAFSTSKRYGFSICFNPACAAGSQKRLTLENLTMELKGLERLPAKRYVLQKKGESGESFEDKFDSIQDEPEELPEFPSSAIDKMHDRFLNHDPAKQYMKGRGFTLETMKHFRVGFTPASTGPVYRAHDMIVVPAYDNKARPVGLVGRSIEGKEFKNFGPSDKGTGFHKSKIVWNLNNARRYESIVLTEATFDSMAVHQAGYANTGALLGGSLSNQQKLLLRRHFGHIIIMTDNENKENGHLTYHRRCAKCLKAGYDMCNGHAAGRELGMRIADEMPDMRVSWAMYDDRNVYARNVKDARAMSDDEIRQSLRNMVSHYEYLEWVA